MKIIALLPFRNEERFIPSYLSCVVPAVDEIIAIDDNSNDQSAELLRTGGATVYSSDMKEVAGWPEFGIRQKLLQLGREAGGTHFVILDADETFTGQFPKYIRAICKRMKPGRKLRLQWLAMWKSVDHYKDDNTVWSNNFKDFIYCDDGTSEYPNVWMHTPRTPGNGTDESNSDILNTKYGAVYHFQFSDWTSFQIKQCWLRCSELLKGKGSPIAINQKYAITLDQESRLSAIPDDWKEGVVFPTVTCKVDPKELWRFKQLEEWFKKHGPEYFGELHIWHEPNIKALAGRIKNG